MCVWGGGGGGGGATEFLKKVRPTTYLGVCGGGGGGGGATEFSQIGACVLSPKAIIFITHDYIEK